VITNVDLAVPGSLQTGVNSSYTLMVASVVREEVHDIDEMMQIVDEESQIIEYNRQLEEKSAQFENASNDLKAANFRVLELDKLKGEFVSTVSHELRTPLTSIHSFSEIIFGSPDLPPQQREKFVSIIAKESERLIRLIDGVLDIAGMESGKLEWQLRVLDPKVVIDKAISATAGLFRQGNGILLQVSIPGNLPLVDVDSDRLTQVVINLISNAVKFCDTDKGEVWITAKTEEDCLIVSVQDNGRGIDLRDHQKIFERFQQVGNQVIGKPKGSGPGLPICTEIISQFGGKTWVDSQLAKGATFTFRIPPASSPGVGIGGVT
jgi:signal transduction histidine kinase